jgi:hypothetical protein
MTMTLQSSCAGGETRKCELDWDDCSTPTNPFTLPQAASVGELVVGQDYRQEHSPFNNPVDLDHYPQDPQSHSLQRISSNTSSNDSVNLASSTTSTVKLYGVPPLVSSPATSLPYTSQEELELGAVCASHYIIASNTAATLSSSTTSDISTTHSSSCPATSRLVLDWSNRRTSRAIYTTSSGISKVQLVVKPAQIRTRAVIERRKWQIPFQIESTSSLAAITSSIVEPPPVCQS